MALLRSLVVVGAPLGVLLFSRVALAGIPATSCSDASVARAVGVPEPADAGEGPWAFGCKRLKDGSYAAAAFANETAPDTAKGELRVATYTKKGEVTWQATERLVVALKDGMPADGDVISGTLALAERFGVVVEEVGGKASGVRVGVIAARGEDALFSEELIVLYRRTVDGKALERIWTAAGAAYSATIGDTSTCDLDRSVKVVFSKRDALKVETVVREGNGGPTCKRVTKKDTQTVTLPQ